MNPIKFFRQARLIVPAAGFLLSGCASSSQQSLAKASDAFFEAFNHLCEEDGLQGKGTVEIQGLSGEYTAGFTSSPQQAALSLFFAENESVGFYLREGRTYLDYFGTKSSSEASGIGIFPDTVLRLPNPFLELSKQERTDLFSSVEIHEDTYSFVFKNSEMEKFLDNYGAVRVNQASLEAVIHEGTLSWIALSVEGVYDIQSQSTPLNLEASCAIEQTGKDVSLRFPADLSPQTWNQSATKEQTDLFEQALNEVNRTQEAG